MIAANSYRRLWTIAVAMLATACTTPPSTPAPAPVLFVCEHGNVKSLMAASYFNQLAAQRRLPFRAISRGTAPNSTTVPAPVVAGLESDGLELGEFRPLPVSAEDVSAAGRIVVIGTDLPAGNEAASSRLERWNDVPAASVSYGAARDSLKAHIEDLLQRLAAQQAR
jgi:arsenate reductase (thioredoxin)